MVGRGPRSAIERAEIGNSRPTVVRACALLDPPTNYHTRENDLGKWAPLKLIAIVALLLCSMGRRERPYHKSPQTKTCDRTGVQPWHASLASPVWSPLWCSGMISSTGGVLWRDPTRGGAAVTFNEGSMRHACLGP